MDTSFQVVCAKCSGQKFPLTFEDNKLCRVCRSCYNILVFNQKQQLLEATNRVVAANEAAVTNGDDEESEAACEPPVGFNGGRRKSEFGRRLEDVPDAAILEPTRPRGLLEVCMQ